MADERFADHLENPRGLGELPPGGYTATAGGAACGDFIHFGLASDGKSVTAAGFTAEGCGATTAAASVAVELVTGADLLRAARIGWREISDELGGLISTKRHAAELAADALHRALGLAARDAKLPSNPDRALIAMSGGVDSTVVALLESERTSDCVAVTLELWADEENDAQRSCCSAAAVRGAREIAHREGIPHFTLDLRDEFRAGVVTPFLEAHAAAQTPNPCVNCNGFVRLDGMLDFADALGALTLATGHYARTVNDESGVLLRVAADTDKDQSYMLCALSSESLARMRFPLGELTKPEVRIIAGDRGLAVARKPDSQDLCFLAGTDLRRFLERHGEIAAKPGEIRTQEGELIGEHEDVRSFTIGQRRGIGIGGGVPYYVVGIDQESGAITVGPKESLACSEVRIRDVTLRREAVRANSAKLRYRTPARHARVNGASKAGQYEELELRFDKPVSSTARGQIACLYDGEIVVGYGTVA